MPLNISFATKVSAAMSIGAQRVDLYIPGVHAGKLIGPRGSTLAHLQAQHRVSIIVDSYDTAPGPGVAEGMRLVAIVGPSAVRIEHARAEIEDMMSECSARHKTVACLDFPRGGCSRGRFCPFAHGAPELRQLPGLDEPAEPAVVQPATATSVAQQQQRVLLDGALDEKKAAPSTVTCESGEAAHS